MSTPPVTSTNLTTPHLRRALFLSAVSPGEIQLYSQVVWLNENVTHHLAWVALYEMWLPSFFEPKGPRKKGLAGHAVDVGHPADLLSQPHPRGRIQEGLDRRADARVDELPVY